MQAFEPDIFPEDHPIGVRPDPGFIYDEEEDW